MKVCIIGAGIAARSLAFNLSKNFEVTLIADDELAPACSTRSTGVVANRATQEGLSDLGDLNIEAYKEFVSFVRDHEPAGIEAITHKQAWRETYSKNDIWKKRFNPHKENELFVHREQAYLVYPETYLNWFNCEVVNDYITQIKPGKLIGRKNIYQADIIINASGAYSKLLFKDEVIARSKPIVGSYLVFETPVDKSQSITFESVNIIKRAHTNEILIGATSNESEFTLFEAKECLQGRYELACEYLELPSFNLAQIKTGLRHKGIKRMPFWGKLDNGIYSVHSLYKNGWSYSILAAKKLAAQILRECSAS